jgi:hypothetical protein
VLLVLIVLPCLAILVFGVAMCRMAAQGDDWDAAALASWIPTRYLDHDEQDDSPGHAHPLPDQLPFDRQRGAWRATG